MKSLLEKLSIVFSAGCFGALVNSFFFWGIGRMGLLQACGVQLTPQLTPDWLYQRVVWGGLWAMMFLLPLMPKSIIIRGTLFSLAPTFFELCVVFPAKTGSQIFGIDRGILTPLVILVVNAVWGISAVLWLRVVAKKKGENKPIYKTS